MDTKKCISCDTTQYVSEFHTINKKSGHVYIVNNCKNCEKIRKKKPEYVQRSLERHKEYYKENRDQMITKSKSYYDENRDKVKKYQCEYHKRPDVVKKRKKKRYDRRQENEEYRIMCNLSARITKLLKTMKSTKSIKLIGCTIPEFKKWIEWQFDSNMSWDNYGTYWHIDHVTPCNSFNLANLEEQFICFHWSNCRPLEKTKNIVKSDSVIPIQILLHDVKIHHYKSYFCDTTKLRESPKALITTFKK